MGKSFLVLFLLQYKHHFYPGKPLLLPSHDPFQNPTRGKPPSEDLFQKAPRAWLFISLGTPSLQDIQTFRVTGGGRSQFFPFLGC